MTPEMLLESNKQLRLDVLMLSKSLMFWSEAHNQVFDELDRVRAGLKEIIEFWDDFSLKNEWDQQNWDEVFFKLKELTASGIANYPTVGETHE